MKSVLEYLENIKNDNKVIDKFGSRTYKEILKNAKVIGSKLGSFVKNNDPVPVYMEKSISTLEVLYMQAVFIVFWMLGYLMLDLIKLLVF